MDIESKISDGLMIIIFIILSAGVLLTAADLIGATNAESITDTILSVEETPDGLIKEPFEQEGISYQFDSWVREEIQDESGGRLYEYTIVYEKVSFAERMSKCNEIISFVCVESFVPISLFALACIFFKRDAIEEWYAKRKYRIIADGFEGNNRERKE